MVHHQGTFDGTRKVESVYFSNRQTPELLDLDWQIRTAGSDFPAYSSQVGLNTVKPNACRSDLRIATLVGLPQLGL